MSQLNTKNLSYLGLAEPFFKKPIPVGQLNFPEWGKFRSVFEGIFERKYYTNHGPLTQELESKLCKFLGVKHAITMTNGTIALIIAAKALGLTGKVICPSFTFIATPQSLTWADLEPVFCDVDPDTHLMDPEHVEELIKKNSNVSAILAVNLWGEPCNIEKLQSIADKHKIKLYFDSAHAFGCEYNNKKFGSFGECEIFSFHATKILNATEGGCVCTNNDELAAKLRNIRSSYGAGHPVDIPFTGNGRFSEAQAAIALLSLKDFQNNLKRNEKHYRLYEKLLSDISGLKFFKLGNNHNKSNYQYIVVEVNEKEFGLSRDFLVKVLKAENVIARSYFNPVAHKSIPYSNTISQSINLPNTDKISQNVMQLPSGQPVNEEIITKICQLIKLAKDNAPEILRIHKNQ